MSFKSLVFAYLIGLAVVTAMALYAPIVGIGASLFAIGRAAWTDDWSSAPMATLGLTLWTIAVHYPWPIIGITALVGLLSYSYIYKHSNEPFPLA